TKIGKRKYHKGHRVEGVWVIGGIERSRLKNKIKNENRKSFFLPIDIRNSENIDKIINENVKKGTTKTITKISQIKGNTQCYNNVKNLGYKHKTVNHKKYFKDPITKVHTNGIEGTWSGLKRSINIRNRIKSGIELHLKEYQWRKKNNEYDIWKRFLKIKN
ncbi:hypothetical protein K501DRAFT_187542, partial [Backusella circina FSU 941]